MKKYLLVICVCALLISGCAPSSVSSESFSESESQSWYSPELSMAHVPYEEVTLEDILYYEDAIAGGWYGEEMYREIGDYGHVALTADPLDLCDNTTSLEDFVKDLPVLDSWTTWHMCNLLRGDFGSSFLADLNVMAKGEINKYRYIGNFIAQDNETVVHRMYTVLKSEMGGYVYCFFNYRPTKYPSRDSVSIRTAVYLPETLSYFDFEHLEVGDSLDDVIEVTKVALFLKKNWGMYGFNPYTIHLLSDGILAYRYDETLNIKEIYYNENFIMSIFLRTGNPQLDLPDDLLHNFTILPQDFPVVEEEW